MNLNAPEVAPLAHFCIYMLLSGHEFSFEDVPPVFACSEETFEAVMEEIILQFHTGKPSMVH
jgi:hypothetical protein